jgi:hypothetical protein
MQISKQSNPFYTRFENIVNAIDYVQTFSYLDAGTTDERINTIIHSSVSLLDSITETFAYSGSSGSYRILSITKA